LHSNFGAAAIQPNGNFIPPYHEMKQTDTIRQPQQSKAHTMPNFLDLPTQKLLPVVSLSNPKLINTAVENL
jgi:hypothetical protein